MGLLDKVKNLFTDEEIIEEEEEDTVKIREVKKEEPEETKEHKLYFSLYIISTIINDSPLFSTIFEENKDNFKII